MIVELLEIVCVPQGCALGFVVTAVVEALIVFAPGCAGELEPLEIVGEIFAGIDVADMPLVPVGAGSGEAVGHQLAIVGDGCAGQRDGAVGGERVRIEQEARLGVQRFGDKKDVLLLESGVVLEEVASAMLAGRGVTLVVPELGQAVVNGLAVGNLVEVAEG